MEDELSLEHLQGNGHLKKQVYRQKLGVTMLVLAKRIKITLPLFVNNELNIRKRQYLRGKSTI